MTGGQQNTQQLGEELLERLRATLPEASKDVLGELVRAVLHPGQEEPRDVIGKLLGQGCEASAVQRALSEARDFALARLLPTVLPQASPDMMKMVYAFLAHGDRLHRGLLQALSQQYEVELRQLQGRLVSEGQAHLLTKARHTWQESKGITLYNYYAELRISAYVPLYKVDAHGLVTGRSRDLVPVVAAGEHGHVVHVQLPDSDFCLRLIAEDATASTVHWRFAGLMEASKEKRRDMRVQVDSPTFVTLRHGGQEWRGRVVEFSTQGLGITLPLSQGLFKGQRVDFTLIMHMNEMDGGATVRWLSRHDDMAHAGLELDADPLITEFLEAQMERRHRTILNELRLKGVPDILI